MNRLFLLAAALLSLLVSCGKKESYAYDYVGATLRVESSSPTLREECGLDPREQFRRDARCGRISTVRS